MIETPRRSGAVTLHLRGRVQPGGMPALRSFLTEAIPHDESIGGLRVRLLIGEEDPETFIEEVEYADRDVFELDQRRVEADLVMLAYLDRWRDVLAAPIRVETYLVDTA